MNYNWHIFFSVRFLCDFLPNTYWNSFWYQTVHFFFSENKGYFLIKRIISHSCWQHDSVTKHAMFISHSGLDCSSLNCLWLFPASTIRIWHCIVHHRMDGAQHKPWSKESQVMQFTSRYSTLALFLVQIFCAGTTRPSLALFFFYFSFFSASGWTLLWKKKKWKIFGSGSRM